MTRLSRTGSGLSILLGVAADVGPHEFCYSGTAKDWPSCGAVAPGYPRMHPLDEGLWELLWNLGPKAREGGIRVPRKGRLLASATSPSSRFDLRGGLT